LLAFGAESPENARAAERALFGAQNSYKAITGYSVGLNDQPPSPAKSQKKISSARK